MLLETTVNLLILRPSYTADLTTVCLSIITYMEGKNAVGEVRSLHFCIINFGQSAEVNVFHGSEFGPFNRRFGAVEREKLLLARLMPLSKMRRRLLLMITSKTISVCFSYRHSKSYSPILNVWITLVKNTECAKENCHHFIFDFLREYHNESYSIPQSFCKKQM